MISIQPKSSARRGAAAVELAVCLPILVSITLGGIALNQSISLKTMCKLVADEAAFAATNDSRSVDEAIADAESLARSAQLNEIVIRHDFPDDKTISFIVEAPMKGNVTLHNILPIRTMSARSFAYRVQQ